ncbi:uncharacterized protein LOC117581274 [Drosophila guanche]|uniref:Uncharacterized protein n=1 Tax=Drosophila guanche TaxID=7266 RepID=A0A3B0J8Z5_DROGU|nr:uncharacterized protein LOC117581274 [Drosophila guanche]SPP78365.1 Hypothetical predicted protein [Drosophila guanche]
MAYPIVALLSVLALLLCLSQSCWAAPSGDDLAKFGELERTIKELTSSILTMSAGGGAGAGAGLLERGTGDLLDARDAGSSGSWPEESRS